MSRVHKIMHAHAIFQPGVWVASSEGELGYIADLIKMDVANSEDGRALSVGMVFLKIFCFSFRQLRVQVNANELRCVLASAG